MPPSPSSHSPPPLPERYPDPFSSTLTPLRSVYFFSSLLSVPQIYASTHPMCYCTGLLTGCLPPDLPLLQLTLCFPAVIILNAKSIMASSLRDKTEMSFPVLKLPHGQAPGSLFSFLSPNFHPQHPETDVVNGLYFLNIFLSHFSTFTYPDPPFWNVLCLPYTQALSFLPIH